MTCRSCGESIVWATMLSSGKPHPFNPTPEPLERGYKLEEAPDTGDLGATYVHHKGETEPLYVSHFATCPHAQRHRRVK